MYLGPVDLEGTIYVPLNTHNPATGAAQDADTLPIYRVYEDSVGTPVITGTFALLDATNTTGFYVAAIAVTTANGFNPNLRYAVYCQATVGGVMGTVSHVFFVSGVAGQFLTYQASGEVTAVISAEEFDTDLSAPDAAFDGLLVSILTGPAAGQSQYCEEFTSTGGKIKLFEALTIAPAVGDNIGIVPARRGLS